MHIPGMATSDRRRPRGIEAVQERAPLRGGKGGLTQTSSRKKWWSSLRQCKSRRSVVDVGRERESEAMVSKNSMEATKLELRILCMCLERLRLFQKEAMAHNISPHGIISANEQPFALQRPRCM